MAMGTISKKAEEPTSASKSFSHLLVDHQASPQRPLEQPLASALPWSAEAQLHAPIRCLRWVKSLTCLACKSCGGRNSLPEALQLLLSSSRVIARLCGVLQAPKVGQRITCLAGQVMRAVKAALRACLLPPLAFSSAAARSSPTQDCSSGVSRSTCTHGVHLHMQSVHAKAAPMEPGVRN